MLFDYSIEGIVLGSVLILVFYFVNLFLKRKYENLSIESKRIIYKKTHKLVITLVVLVYIPMYGFGFLMRGISIGQL